MNEKKKKQIRELLDKYLAEYIPMQEIIHVCDQLCSDLTTDKIHEMMDYLMRFDKEFIYLQTVNTKPITNNQVRLCMAEITKFIESGEESPR